MSEPSKIELNGHEITVKRNALAKRISLKISQRGGIILVLPIKTKIDKAIKFAKSKQDWINENISKIPAPNKITIGSSIPLMGCNSKIIHSGYFGKTYHEQNNIYVFAKPDYIEENVISYLKSLALKKVNAYSEQFSKQTGLKYKNISIRDSKTRWGSCSSSGNITFSWRLIMMPDFVMQYVVAHEIAHLKEMNHGQNFWNLVEKIFPDYIKARKWLKQNGRTIHSWEF